VGTVDGGPVCCSDGEREFGEGYNMLADPMAYP
jgi:hypothetical protein